MSTGEGKSVSQSLVTICTYWDAVEARLAKVYLEQAGIRSVLQNENSVTMNWLEFAISSKGVQLQVVEADVDRAIDVLEQRSPGTNEIGDEWQTDESPSENEDEYVDDHFSEDEPRDPTDPPTVAADSIAPLNEREQRIRRAYVTAVVGLLFFPAEFYATYQLGISLLSEEPVRDSVQKMARNAVLVNGAVLLTYFLFAWQCSQYGIDPIRGIYEAVFG